jgi:hypothetical protein
MSEIINKIKNILKFSGYDDDIPAQIQNIQQQLQQKCRIEKNNKQIMENIKQQLVTHNKLK